MIRPRTLPLGPLQPDLAAILNASGLRAANNVLPTKSGYEPMLALADIGENAITLRPRGGISGTDRANNPWNYVGQADKIYEIASSGTRDASKVGGYSCTGTERWAFAEFGTVVIATSFNDPLQYIDTAAPLGTYADVPELSPGVGVPRGRRIGVVENHVILGDCYDAVYGAVPDSIWWGAIKQPLSYPEINSDLAASLQSDRQPLRGEGGPVQAVIGGAEVGAIFQERAIWRMDYRGGATIFELTRVVPDMGLLVPELAVAFPRGVFFLAEDGFYVFDYNAATPIGKDRMNQAFLDDYDRDYPDRVWAIDDPDSTRIWVVYPGAGNSSGRPNKALVWDWALDLFTTGEFDMEMPAHILPGGITLDTLPDDNLDTFEPTTSFDARQSAAGVHGDGQHARHRIGNVRQAGGIYQA